MTGITRIFLMVVGGVSLLLGVLGIFLPLLPTTPFVLLTAICWGKSSEKFHNWLTNHKLFGNIVVNWETHRVIPLKAKWLSTIMMNGMIFISAFFVVSSPWWAKTLMVSMGISVSIWIWSFPNHIKEIVKED